MKNQLSTAQSAAALFAQVTGTELTTNHAFHGAQSLTSEPWPTVLWADGSVTDFLPGEVQHFNAETDGVAWANTFSDSTVAQVLAAALSLRA